MKDIQENSLENRSELPLNPNEKTDKSPLISESISASDLYYIFPDQCTSESKIEYQADDKRAYTQISKGDLDVSTPEVDLPINYQKVEKKEETLFDVLKGELGKIGSKFSEFLESEDVKNILERARTDKTLLNYLKEKYPETFGECKGLADVVLKVGEKNQYYSKEFYREYYSLQMVVGGAFIVVTNTGGPIGKFVGTHLIKFGYEHSKLLNRYIKREDLDKLVSLYEKNLKNKKS
jgi:hypothetical protein